MIILNWVDTPLEVFSIIIGAWIFGLWFAGCFDDNDE